MKKDRADYYNETSNTAAGINTPPENENIAATDMLSDAVEQIVDNVSRAFGNDEPEDHGRSRVALGGLSPNDEATPALESAYAETDTRPSRVDDVERTDVAPTLEAEEGTPVDPAAPKDEIVHGTDLLNGYGKEDGAAPPRS